ncbi:MAG: hypothetical protein M1360_03395 [Candidatus Marsarchaeota archaeon]|jgi:hypothetical protein|nr:hypothetical protein [Candidatus Marsarchaeota archaeon]MCL5418958.1 hypothetical protein [Candidatus Marsarchaeota archaeon]
MTKQEIPEKILFPKKREYYNLSEKLIWIIFSAVTYNYHHKLSSKWQSVKYGDMIMRLAVRWPGKSVELLVNNKKVFEAGSFLLSGVVTYSKFRKEAITPGILNKLFELEDLVETAEDPEAYKQTKLEARNKLAVLTKRVGDVTL